MIQNPSQWTDRNGDWHRRMARRHRMFLACMLVAMLFGLAPVVFGLFARWRAVKLGADMKLTWPLLNMVIWTVAAVWMVRVHRQHRRLVCDVAETDARVCPMCRGRLAAAPDEMLQCGRCRRAWQASDIARYWSDYSWHPGAAWRWRAEQGAMQDQAGRGRRFLNRVRVALLGSPVRQAVAVAALMLVMQMVFAVLFGVRLLQMWGVLLPMMLFMCGGVLAFGKARHGDSRHCSTCEYQLPPGDAGVARCPECGTLFDQQSRVVTGVSVRQPWHRAVGGIFVAIGVVTWSLNTFAPELRAGFTPTRVLMMEVAGGVGFAQNQWAELQARTLTQQQKQTLATGLLDRRIRDGYLFQDASGWLSREVAAGTLTPALVERFYVEALQVNIVAPQHARVGERVNVSIQGVHRPAFLPAAMSGSMEQIIIGDLSMNHVTQDGSRHDEALTGYQLDDKPISETFVVSEVGQAVVRWRVWLVNGPVIGKITWGEDGTPSQLTSAVWTRSMVLEATIPVSK